METSPSDKIILELLDRFGKVKQRHVIDQFPCKIGRAYDNDIILDDPFISPHHADITCQESVIQFHDAGSENGSFTLHPLEKHKTINLTDNTRVRIGHTDLRFRHESHHITETVIERNKPSKFMMLFTNVLMFPIIWACLLAAFVVDNYLSSIEQVTFNTHLKVALPVLIFITLWALAWALVSKIVTHRFYFSFHAIWIGSLLLVSYLGETAFAFIEFGFSISGAQTILTLLLDLVLMSVLFYGHLRYSTTVNRYNAKRLGITAAIVITVFLQLNDLANNVDFSNRPAYSKILKPPMFIMAKVKSTEEFLAETESLQFEWEDDKEDN